MVILYFGPAQQDCSVLIIFINSYVYIYIYIHNLYPLPTHYSLFSHIKFNSVSSLLIHSYKIISRMLYISISIQFPSIFHPFFFSASVFIQFIQFHPLSSIIHPYIMCFFIHFHPFLMLHHWCSSIFALFMLSSIYNPVIFHFHPVAFVHTALERSLFYRIPQRFPNGHSMFRSGTARL